MRLFGVERASQLRAVSRIIEGLHVGVGLLPNPDAPANQGKRAPWFPRDVQTRITGPFGRGLTAGLSETYAVAQLHLAPLQGYTAGLGGIFNRYQTTIPAGAAPYGDTLLLRGAVLPIVVDAGVLARNTDAAMTTFVTGYLGIDLKRGLRAPVTSEFGPSLDTWITAATGGSISAIRKNPDGTVMQSPSGLVMVESDRFWLFEAATAFPVDLGAGARASLTGQYLLQRHATPSWSAFGHGIAPGIEFWWPAWRIWTSLALRLETGAVVTGLLDDAYQIRKFRVGPSGRPLLAQLEGQDVGDWRSYGAFSVATDIRLDRGFSPHVNSRLAFSFDGQIRVLGATPGYDDSRFRLEASYRESPDLFRDPVSERWIPRDPEILSPWSLYFEAITFTAATSGFSTIEGFFDAMVFTLTGSTRLVINPDLAVIATIGWQNGPILDDGYFHRRSQPVVRISFSSPF